MAELLTQDDLNALWGPTPGDESQGPDGAKENIPAPAAGLSQADLDALWGGASQDAPGKEEENAPSVGLSQADLDALWGLAPKDPAPQEARPKPAMAETDTSAGASENLSQDDIDRLLSEFGK